MNFVRRYALMASLLVAIVSTALAIYFQQQGEHDALALKESKVVYEQLAKEYNAANQQLEKYREDQDIAENPKFTKVTLKGTANDPDARAVVYWNSSTHELYVSAQNLKSVSADKQFQVWAIVRGKPVSTGLFDLPAIGLLRINDIDEASAFAITVELRGGRDQPSWEALQVIGSVFIIPS